VPDANLNGTGEILVGAPGEDAPGALGAGRAHLLRGEDGVLRDTLKATGALPNERFGESVSGVLRVTNQSRPGALVSAPRQASGVSEAGQAYLFNAESGDLLFDLDSDMPQEAGRFGQSISGVRNGSPGDQGRGGVLVGAPWEAVAGDAQAGRAYFFRSDGGRLKTFESPNREGKGYFGWCVSGVPTVNNDIVGDLLVGAYGEDGGARNAGRAYLFSGVDPYTRLRTLESPKPAVNGHFGRVVAGVEDTDGDQRGDLLVSAPNEASGPRVYLFGSRNGSGIRLSASGDPTTVAPGGSVTVTVRVTNESGAAATLDGWMVMSRDGTPLRTVQLGTATVPNNASSERSFALGVPDNTTAGVYRVEVNVGRFSYASLASAAFDVTVTSPPVVAVASSTAWSTPPVVSPNPFEGRTAIRFALDAPGAVRLAVSDVLGREVARLVDGEREAGAHVATFDARGLASGVYVWRLATGGTVRTGRMTLVR
jgi:hypothetical protein